MNLVNVQQTGGFPLETDTLQAMQQAYNIFNSLGNLVAPLGIISGCEVNGSNVGSGVVFINGEVIDFRGGALSPYVIIQEDVQAREFESGEIKEVYRERYAMFGETSTGVNYPWNDFHRSISNQEIQRRLMPVGCIPLDYCGAVENIPAGYHLCDGTHGTPDLRGMFIAGYDPRQEDYNAIGKTGGTNQNQPTITVQDAQVSIEIPVTGYGTSGSKPSPSTSIASGRLVVGSGNPELGEDLESLRAAGYPQTAGGKHGHTATSNRLDNRPTYYVLAKIMYIG